MFDYEKMAYEQRNARRHQERNSYDSKASSNSGISNTSSDGQVNEKDSPPAYASIFYNRVDDKPLPPLPASSSSPSSRRVRFVTEKPLPPLPQGSRKLKRTSSRQGEYVWWAQNKYKLSEEQWDMFAREKSPWKD